MLATLLGAFVSTLITFVQPYAQDHHHHHTLSPQNTLCLTDAIYHEARGETVIGQAAIAYIVLNRTAISGASLCQEIHRRGQFSYYNPAHKTLHGRELDAWKLASYVAVYTQLGLLPNTIGNATMYADTPMPSWHDDASFYRHVGHHYFYRRRDVAATPPLVAVTPVVEEASPRLILCDTLLANQKRLDPPRSSEVSTRSLFMRETYFTQEIRGPAPMIVDAVVRLPPSIPFPVKPALSPNQATSLTSALSSSGPSVHPAHKPPSQSVIRFAEHHGRSRHRTRFI